MNQQHGKNETQSQSRWIGGTRIALANFFFFSALVVHGQVMPSTGRTLVSDWAMALPLTTVSSILTGTGYAIQVRDQSFDYADVSAGQTVKASVQGLSLSAGKSISKIQFGEGGNVTVEGGLQGLTVHMKKLSFSVSVEVPLTPGAAPVRTSLEGECSDVTAVFLRPVALSLQTRYDQPSMRFRVENWAWDIENGQYAWFSQSCKGPSGISEFLRQRVFQKFVGSDRAREFVMAQADSFFNDIFSGAMGRMFSESLMGLGLKFQVEKIAWTKDTFSLDGRSEVNDPNGCAAFNLGTSRSRISLDGATRTGLKLRQLIFPEETLMKTVQCLHEGQRLAFDGTTGDLSGFDQLMKNRTNQSFVWPDLGSFPTTQVFIMKSRTNDKLTLTPSSTTSGFLGSLNTSLISYWFSNTGPYVTFWTPVSASVRVNIDKDKLVMSTSSARSINISYRFERKVSDNYIDTSQFTQPVTDFVNSIKQSWPLPILELPGGRKLIPTTLTTVPGKAWIFTMKD